ncbi:MAG: hypothetical protein WAV95_12010 [Azonexus sp.]
MPLIRIYPYVAPLVLAPLSFWLWWGEYGNWPQVLVAWLIPVLWAYIVPGVGTNICGVWEFDARWKLGRFRPQHGFVFGSATASLAWLLHGQPAQSVGDVLRYAVVLCSVLGFWNFLYEVRALQSGMLKVYNQPWADGRGEEAIVFDYAPWFFGGFGAAYGLLVAGLEYFVHRQGLPGPWLTAAVVLGGLAGCIALPVFGFIRQSRRKHGHPGTRPVFRE